nr:4Fe-4S dicluster domain-containing protein [Chitinophagaceae bacterium]
IVPLTESGAAMVELMDRASLRSVENKEGIMPFICTLDENAAALLVEFQEENEEALLDRISAFFEKSSGLSLLAMPVFTQNDKERDFYWKVRKGLFPSVGAVRTRGTTVILEDIAFPVRHMGAAILDLQQLFKKHRYSDGIIFGHAKDGNIHFVITQSFNTPSEVARYDVFIREVVELVICKYHGTLKAEHGTGRNMAPFVETEWGGEAYQIMKRVKALADPHALLNPGVIINENKNAHIADLKELPGVEEEVDKCIECGYCEHICPSRDITTTPRRRIIIRRALQTMKNKGNSADYKLLSRQFQYDGIETCAVDGLCAGACPVDINTGDLIKRLRKESHSIAANNIAVFVARHFSAVEKMVRVLLKTGTLANKIAGKKTMSRFTGLLKRFIPLMPLWTSQISAPPSLKWIKQLEKQESYTAGKTVVYFASCISRMMGSYEGRSKNIMECLISVCGKSDISVIVPKRFHGSCCSQLFSSKGYKEASRYKANEIIGELWEISGGGKWPVVMDVSSCTFTLKNLRGVLSDENIIKYDGMKFLDSVDFLHDVLMPAGKVKQKADRIVLHPVCSLEKMKISAKLEAVARHYAHEVSIPKNTGCCGMAGDRGFLFPELTASATHAEAGEVKQGNYSGYYSTTKTCEMALSDATGASYESILYLIDECS